MVFKLNYYFFYVTQFTPKYRIYLSIVFFKTFCFKMLWVFQYRFKKNEYKLSIHSLNTQIVQHVEKFRLFFYRSCDHGHGIMTSYLGSLVYKSLKVTKIMPNSLKLLDHYSLCTSFATYPKKHVSRSLLKFNYRIRKLNGNKIIDL